MNRTISSSGENKKKYVSELILVVIIVLSSYFPEPRADGTAENKLINRQKKPADYLFFQSIPDGKCQTLSDGGKLRLLFSRHPYHGINFRLIRFFAGKKQGLSQGIIYPHSDGYKLGCSIVDGRQQDWVLERAIFTNDQGTKAE